MNSPRGKKIGRNRAGNVPGGSKRNLAAVAPLTDFGGLDDVSRILAVDAQTSGGLLLAVAPGKVDGLCERLRSGGDAAAVIGEIVVIEPGAPHITLT